MRSALTCRARMLYPAVPAPLALFAAWSPLVPVPVTGTRLFLELRSSSFQYTGYSRSQVECVFAHAVTSVSVLWSLPDSPRIANRKFVTGGRQRPKKAKSTSVGFAQSLDSEKLAYPIFGPPEVHSGVSGRDNSAATSSPVLFCAPRTNSTTTARPCGSGPRRTPGGGMRQVVAVTRCGRVTEMPRAVRCSPLRLLLSASPPAHGPIAGRAPGLGWARTG